MTEIPKDFLLSARRRSDPHEAPEHGYRISGRLTAKVGKLPGVC
ncbi:hypothetical protein [Planomonospora alba]